MKRRSTVISDEVECERLQDPLLREKMERAKFGQEPEFIIISSIHRSAQDLQMLGMLQADAFHSTRVTGQPVLSLREYLFLFSKPAAYNSHFPRHAGVIITFDEN